MVMPSKTAASYGAAAQKAAAIVKTTAKPLKATPKQRKVIEAMVFDGLKRKDAAKLHGMSDEAIRVALTKPHTLAYLNECQEVLRTSLRPRALLRIGKLVDKADSDRVRLDAAKYVDGMDRGAHQMGAVQVNVQSNVNLKMTPGYVIDLTADTHQQIEHLAQEGRNAMVHNADVPDED